DMRGFYLGGLLNDPLAQTEVNQSDMQIHFPDKWKLPSHPTFSQESIYSNSKQDPYFNSLRNKLFQSQESPKEELWDNISSRLNKGVKRKKSLFFASLILLISPIWFNNSLPNKGVFKEVVFAKNEQDISESKRKFISPKKNGRASKCTILVARKANNTPAVGIPPRAPFNRTAPNEKAPESATTGFPETVDNSTIVSNFQNNEESILNPTFPMNFSVRNPIIVPLTLTRFTQPKLLSVNVEDLKARPSFLVSQPWEIAMNTRFSSNTMKLDPQAAWEAKSLPSFSSNAGMHISHQLFKVVYLQSGIELEKLGVTAQIHQSNVAIDTISGRISLQTPFDGLEMYQSNLVHHSAGQGEEDEE
ncbi:MAG: hypothetical protein EBV19_10910, partial [Flavobacteriia bacterium]|nr:hypothetical protein [Flavobacteriia bacterium]